MKKKSRIGTSPADAAWDSFVKTGNITYYVLYKKLTEE